MHQVSNGIGSLLSCSRLRLQPRAVSLRMTWSFLSCSLLLVRWCRARAWLRCQAPQAYGWRCPVFAYRKKSTQHSYPNQSNWLCSACCTGCHWPSPRSLPMFIRFTPFKSRKLELYWRFPIIWPADGYLLSLRYMRSASSSNYLESISTPKNYLKFGIEFQIFNCITSLTSSGTLWTRIVIVAFATGN